MMPWLRIPIPAVPLVLALASALFSAPDTALPPRLKSQPGKVVEAIPVQDRTGISWLIIRETVHGEMGSKAYRNSLTAGQYSVRADVIQTVWQLKDFNGNPLESIDYRKGSYQLMDANLDGIQDILLWYRKIQDGTDPDTLKLFLYVLGKKHVIRGRIPKLGSDLDLYEKKVDPLTESAPKAIRDSLLSKWESIVKPEMDSLKAETED